MHHARIAVSLCAILCACVATPERPAGPEPFKPGGLHLTASDRVEILVASDASPDDPGSDVKRERFSTNQEEAIAAAFGEGFRTNLPNMNLHFTDGANRKKCLDAVSLATGVDLDAMRVRDDCRTPIDYRYMIVLRGSRHSSSSFDGFGGGGGFAFGATFQQVLRLRASAYDLNAGTLACERDRTTNTSSYTGLAVIGGGMGALAIPLVAVSDEPAFWTHTAWRLGYVVAGCFVQPDPAFDLLSGEESEAGRKAYRHNPDAENAPVPESIDVTFAPVFWWFNGNEPIPGRMAVARDRLVFFERLPSGVEAPYEVNYAQIKIVSLIQRQRVQGPLISLRLSDEAAEYFSVAKADSGVVDIERTTAAYEMIKRRVSDAKGQDNHGNP